LQVDFTGGELPVRVLRPGVDHHLVGRIVGVLQVQQASHKTGRQSRSASARGEVASEVMLDQFPVHQPSQADQRLLHVELLVQARAKHVRGLGCGWMRLMA